MPEFLIKEIYKRKNNYILFSQKNVPDRVVTNIGYTYEYLHMAARYAATPKGHVDSFSDSVWAKSVWTANSGLA